MWLTKKLPNAETKFEVLMDDVSIFSSGVSPSLVRLVSPG